MNSKKKSSTNGSHSISLSKTNPVAKNLRKFNKGVTMVDRKKEAKKTGKYTDIRQNDEKRCIWNLESEA